MIGSISKKSAGISYMEMLIAFALFAVLVIAALPLLSQAGRNLGFAMYAHEGHLSAQGIMMSVRDAGATQFYAAAASEAARLGVEHYGVWIFRENVNSGEIEEIFISSSPPHELPQISASVEGWGSLVLSPNTAVIVVAVFDEHGNIIGRAVGVR